MEQQYLVYEGISSHSWISIKFSEFIVEFFCTFMCMYVYNTCTCACSSISVPGDDNQMLLRQWESVLREGTATPSESQGGGAARGKGGDGSGEGGAGQKDGSGDGTTPENQHDANSEPEAPNDSSAEEESG